MSSPPAALVSAGHGTSAPDACSVGFDRSAVSAYGTAARAGFWLALEQDGPWGRAAATESHLPRELGRWLDQACSSRGGRLALLRRPGRHADVHHSAGRTAYLAFSGQSPWLLTTRGATLEQLTSLDFDALARGDEDAVRGSLADAERAEPVLLVCTNGRRDVCCAIRGRPVALEAAKAAPGRVWESSHTGGHRFAPTAVLLPFGVALARLDAARCADVLDASRAGRLPEWALGPGHDRGRSSLPGAGQGAESFVRALIGETSLTALSTTQAGDVRAVDTLPASQGAGASAAPAEVFVVTHRDGRQWAVAAVSEPTSHDLRESCGKPAIATHEWHLRLV